MISSYVRERVAPVVGEEPELKRYAVRERVTPVVGEEPLKSPPPVVGEEPRIKMVPEARIELARG